MSEQEKKKKFAEAAALSYDPVQGGAPKIIAAGKGIIAENIVREAREAEVPVYEDRSLAHALTSLNLGDEIPAELYEVVARIMVFVAGLDQAYGGISGRK